jgi:hypothetical protein
LWVTNVLYKCLCILSIIWYSPMDAYWCLGLPSRLEFFFDVLMVVGTQTRHSIGSCNIEIRLVDWIMVGLINIWSWSCLTLCIAMAFLSLATKWASIAITVACCSERRHQVITISWYRWVREKQYWSSSTIATSAHS